MNIKNRETEWRRGRTGKNTGVAPSVCRRVERDDNLHRKQNSTVNN